eukprot:6907033-Alexandrium_andersonii.AAC.1
MQRLQGVDWQYARSFLQYLECSSSVAQSFYTDTLTNGPLLADFGRSLHTFSADTVLTNTSLACDIARACSVLQAQVGLPHPPQPTSRVCSSVPGCDMSWRGNGWNNNNNGGRGNWRGNGGGAPRGNGGGGGPASLFATFSQTM